MLLSDLSVKRPVFATVISLLLVVFGLVAFFRLPLREYPNIDPPVVSIETNYTGAAANVVETRITELIEDSIAGVEGIKTISSSSVDGRSQITVEFNGFATSATGDRNPADAVGAPDAIGQEIRRLELVLNSNMYNDLIAASGETKKSADDLVEKLTLSSIAPTERDAEAAGPVQELFR